MIFHLAFLLPLSDSLLGELTTGKAEILAVGGAILVLVGVVTLLRYVRRAADMGAVSDDQWDEDQWDGVCHECGAAVDPSSDFCGSCGAGLTDDGDA